MFQKDAEGGNVKDTVIAHGVKVEGEFESQGNIIIEGEVHGTVKTERNLQVGEQARVVANVIAENAVVAGEIQGTVKIHEKLELAPTSRITGDVRAKTVNMSPGAILNGKFSMPGGPEKVRAGASEKKRSRAKVAVPVEAEEPQTSG